MREVRTVLFWQRAPYDVFAGGDGLYLSQFQNYLVMRGWSVVIATTSLDRPRLILEPVYGPHAKRIARSVYAGSRKTYVLPSLMLSGLKSYIGRAVYKNLKSRFPQASKSEIRWVANAMRQTKPDLVVKCFDPSTDGLDLVPTSALVLHLIGFTNPSSMIISNGKIWREDADVSLSFIRGDATNAKMHAKHRSAVGFSSRYEAEAARELDYFRSIYIGLGFGAASPLPSSSDKCVIFVGNKTGPNFDAVKFLLLEIWPIVFSKVPGASLRIVGRIGSMFSDEFAGVTFVGEIDDLKQEYGRASVVVAPLRIGSSGVKTKIGEALMYGRAIVSTSLGVDAGRPLQFQGAARIADSALEISAHLVELLLDPAKRIEAEESAKSVFKDLFSFDAAYSEFDQWIDLCSTSSYSEVE